MQFTISTAGLISLVLPLLLSTATASLNCTVINSPLNYHSCEYPDCPVVGTYKVGEQIQAACRSDCSSPQNVWFKLYNGRFLSAQNVTRCNYYGIQLAPTILPYCYEESMLPKPTTCTRTAGTTATATPPPVITPRPGWPWKA